MENASVAMNGQAMDDQAMNGQMASGPHADNMSMSKDHAALETLIETAQPTHVALKSGSWFDPNTWQGGRVPGKNASVLIGEGISVTYDQESDARIKTIAIKGNLKFATNQDTQLYVETILNGPEGKLDIGSQSQSVAADKNTRIIFTSDRAIDAQWDPNQLSKGLVSHGEVNIYGADKLDAVALVGDAKAGDRVLRFREALSGWQVGDRIVLGGTNTNYGGNDADNSRFQDEVLTITAINGNEVAFTNENITTGANNVLRYDHTRSTQVDANDLTLYAANLTRNVSFETENGKAVPIQNRAHVMLMHNPNVSVLNAGFYDLGRSNKKELVDDVGENIDGSPGTGKNPRGRYSLHLHRTGADDLNNQAAIIRGNAVEGSPGWGIVQHDSHAGLEDNVVFDVVGAGIAAEAGNEIGWWTNNMVIKTTGIPFSPDQGKIEARERRFDFGIDGDAYWIQGAGLIQNQGNKAISSNRTGMVSFASALPTSTTATRDVDTIQIKNLPAELQSLFPEGQTEVDVRDVPAADITGFESYNADTGIRVWGRQTNFDGELAFSSPDVESAHEGRSRIEDFKLWGNRATGATVEYSSNIDMQNGTILSRDNGGEKKHRGIFRNATSMDGSFDDITISGFEQAIEMELPNARNDDKYAFTATLTNNKFINNDYNLTRVGDQDLKDGRPDDFSAYLKMANNEFGPISDNKAPTARFSTQAIGGLAYELDASASFDTDALRPEDGQPYELKSKGIGAYGWDFDGDGNIDKFGRTVKHVFDSAGAKPISLTVLDSQGASSQANYTLNVQPSRYKNAFAAGDFGAGTMTQEVAKSTSQYADKGWYMLDPNIANGYAQLSERNKNGNIIGQVVRNDGTHQGQQTLSFRLKNIEDGGTGSLTNSVEVTLWGVNGQFDNDPRSTENLGPQQVGTLPMERQALVSKTIPVQVLIFTS